ncbi:unnamed protein product [Camellia sinensis]
MDLIFSVSKQPDHIMDSTYSHHKTSTNHPEKQHQHQQHHDQQLQSASSDLLSSAKLMAEAAKAALNHETVDTGRVAGAAADLLEAASHYGKLEEKSFGKYVEKAEDYLHQYHSSHSTTTTTTTASGDTTTTTSTHSSSHSHPNPHPYSGGDEDEDGKSGSGGGYGEYFKMAEGFLKKH